MNTLKIPNCITEVITCRNKRLKDHRGLKDYEVLPGDHTTVPTLLVIHLP